MIKLRKFSSPVSAALLIFFLGVGATVITYYASTATNSESASRKSQQLTSDVSSDIRTGLTAIGEILIGASSNMNLDSPLSYISHYIDNLDADERYPSLRNIGIVAHVEAEEKEAFMADMRSRMGRDFSIIPETQSEYHLPIIFNKSFSDESMESELIGFDVATSQIYKAIVDQSQEKGQLAISPQINVASESGGASHPGIAMVFPIFDDHNEIFGFMFAIIDVQIKFNSVLENYDTDLHISIFDTSETDHDNLIIGGYKEGDEILSSQEINFSNRQWTIAASRDQAVNDNQTFWLIAIGILLSFVSAIFLYLIFRSKTKQYELQKELDIQSAKNDLVSLASHQLRTPATTVKQYLAMVLDRNVGEINEDQQQMLSKAYQSNERQLSIVNQILNLSRLESRKVSPLFQPTNISEMLDDVVKDLLTILPDSKLEVRDDNGNVYANVDVELFRMVLDNIISNAVKYSDNQVVKIVLQDSGGLFSISVRDKGIGIEKSEIDNIFKLFHRIENENTLRVSGTGIGLYLSKVIMDLHGGSIEVESNVGDGSMFKITAPKNPGIKNDK